MAADFKRPDGAAMARILEREPDSPAGAILRLAWLQGLSRKELNDLTWEQVDLDNRVLLLPDRSVPMEPSTEACLRRRWAMHHTRSNRVILADRGGKPMTPENVSRLAREALNREGQTVSLKDLRRAINHLQFFIMKHRDEVRDVDSPFRRVRPVTATNIML